MRSVMGSSSAPAEIRRAETLADLAECAEIANVVEPFVRVTAEQLARRTDGTFLLHSEGGYAFVAPSSFPRNPFAMIRGRPDRRRRGVGSALMTAASEQARSLDAKSMWGRVRADDKASLSFVSRRRFEEIGREVELVREVGPSEGEIPEGVVELRAEHRRGAYLVAVECVEDIPRAGERGEARPYEDWVAEDLAGPVAFAALDTNRVVGYAVLFDQPATPQRLEHGLTAVLRTHRGRGIATALQRAEIAWASAHGYRELVTVTHELNAPLRAVKAKLGYVERGQTIEVRGPLP
jgi:GNAT superfamily N-acetyltransferase